MIIGIVVLLVTYLAMVLLLLWWTLGGSKIIKCYCEPIILDTHSPRAQCQQKQCKYIIQVYHSVTIWMNEWMKGYLTWINFVKKNHWT